MPTFPGNEVRSVAPKQCKRTINTQLQACRRLIMSLISAQPCPTPNGIVRQSRVDQAHCHSYRDVLGSRVQRLLSLLARTFELQLQRWTNWLPTTEGRSWKLLYDWRSVSLSWYRAPLWDLRPESCCLKSAVLFLWGALSDERTGLQFAV
jgi:hypothetical protein